MRHLPLGSFNPRFYGVQFQTSTDDQAEALNSYSSVSDVRNWGSSNEAQRIGNVALVSTPDHEIRHFHDFLLSSFSAMIMAYRMQATLNGFQALSSIASTSGTYLPRPICTWMGWDEDRRQNWVASVSSALGGASIKDFVSLPRYTDCPVQGAGFQDIGSLTDEAQTAQFCCAAAGSYRRIGAMRALRGRTGNQIGPDDIFEAIAYLVQAQAIWSGQGASQAEDYIDHLENGGAPHTIAAKMFTTLIFKSDISLPLGRAVQALSWCLIGPIGDDNGDPLSRFVRLMTEGAKHPRQIFADHGDAAKYWDALDQIFGETPWRDSLDETTASLANRVPQYERVSQQINQRGIDAVVTVFKAYLEDRRSAVAAVKQRADIWGDGGVYVREGSALLPRPLIETAFNTRIFRLTSPLVDPDKRAITVDSANLDVASFVSTLGIATQRALLDPVVDYKTTNHMLDSLFFELGAHDVLGWMSDAHLVAATGKKLVNVF